MYFTAKKAAKGEKKLSAYLLNTIHNHKWPIMFKSKQKIFQKLKNQSKHIM